MGQIAAALRFNRVTESELRTSVVPIGRRRSMRRPRTQAGRVILGTLSAFVLAASPADAISAVVGANASPTNQLEAARAILTLSDISSMSEALSAIPSPDGRYVAFLYTTPDPKSDSYDVVISIRGMRENASTSTVAHYSLQTKQAFEQKNGHLLDSLGQLRWDPDSGHLLYTDHEDAKMRLRLWDIAAARAQDIGGQYDEILISPLTDSGETIVNVVDWKLSHSTLPVDRALLVTRDQQFLGYTPDHHDGFTADSATLLFNWKSFQLTPAPQVATRVSPEDDPGKNLNKGGSAHEVTDTYPAASDPKGNYVATIQWGIRNMESPMLGEMFQRIRIKSAKSSRTLVEIETGNDLHSIFGIGWNEAGSEFYLLEHFRWTSKVIGISTSGKTRTVFEEESDLDEPDQDAMADGLIHVTRSPGYNATTNHVVMARSKGTVSGELISIDLDSGAVVSLCSPNAKLAGGMHGTTSRAVFTDNRYYGRLYLPSAAYKPPFPLVVTTYRTSRGFPRSTTDEIPIPLMVNSGIAVLNFDVDNALVLSEQGNFQWEINHLDGPLRAIEAKISSLAADGVIDAGRVGLSGSSYGQEIAMYAYFNSRAFRTMATMGSGWSPMAYLAAGLPFSDWMKARGYLGIDFSDPKAVAQWKEISAAFNGREDRPPLLWQSGDAERYFSLETWYRLKEADAQIEWLEYPDEGHSKSSPADKWWVYGRNLDWFRFWLQDYQDPDASKSAQYIRWCTIRASWQKAVARRESGTPMNLSRACSRRAPSSSPTSNPIG
jgi:Prolyl oligopeptidase family